jgi:hypothetical protein
MRKLIGICIGLLELSWHRARDEPSDVSTIGCQLPGPNASLDADLLYGVLGLAAMTFGITPDYSLTVDAVFADASRRYLSSSKLSDVT